MEDDSRNHLNEAVLNRTISTGAETPFFSFDLTEGFDLGTNLIIKINNIESMSFLVQNSPNKYNN